MKMKFNENLRDDWDVVLTGNVWYVSQVSDNTEVA